MPPVSRRGNDLACERWSIWKRSQRVLGKAHGVCSQESAGLCYRVLRGSLCHPMIIVNVVPYNPLVDSVSDRKFERELIGTTFVGLHLSLFS